MRWPKPPDSLRDDSRVKFIPQTPNFPERTPTKHYGDAREKSLREKSFVTFVSAEVMVVEITLWRCRDILASC